MKVDIRLQLPVIARKIRQVEENLIPKKHREFVKNMGECIFPLKGPREPWYGPTPMFSLIQYLEDLKNRLNLSASSYFVDLGSGLGRACIAARAVFERVTGFEIIPKVYQEAIRIRDEFQLEGIEYRLVDFHNVSLLPYNIIYFYKPYAQEDIFPKMMLQFLNTQPGTIIISRKYFDHSLFVPEKFTYLAPLDNWTYNFNQPFYPLSEYYCFIKKP